MYAEKYAEDQKAFAKDYAEAHAKLSNLGAKFDPPEVCQAHIVVLFIYTSHPHTPTKKGRRQKKMLEILLWLHCCSGTSYGPNFHI